MSKVIVTVAPTGGMASKAQNANLPTQPAEIAESVYKSWKEGAAIAALHARRPDDEATCNASIYADINKRIRARCDIILNNSTGGGSNGDMLVPRADGLFESNFEERLKGLDAGAEMGTFDGMTFADVHGGREILVVTTPSRCEALAKRFQERGIKPEWEVFGPQHILQDVTTLIKKGYDKPPYYINMVLGADKGFQGAMPYSHDILTAMIGMLPPQSIFCVSGIGPAQLPATTQAILLGGHVRVGLEDNNYYSRGQLATNEQLVARTVRIVKELNMDVASPGEARDILGLAAVGRMIQRVAVVGTGIIGASWASNFLAQGLDVTAYDPAPGAEDSLRRAVTAHWPTMQAIGLAPGADMARLRVFPTLEAALDGAEFVQENGPERLDAKQALFAAMADATPAATVLASSSSTLKVSEVQGGCRHPERIVLGHPFNPPHLIPLVEVVGGTATSSEAIDLAMAFYRQVGKHPIRLKREMKGHVANRLQAALWQEAFHLLAEGVADVADLDAAISHGPGLRWALLGPFLNLHLSGGPGGMAHMLAHLGPPTEAMWRDLGHVALDASTVQRVGDAVRDRVAALDMDSTVAERDETLVRLLQIKTASGLP